MGSQMTSDITETVVDAERYLEVHRPVRRCATSILLFICGFQ